MKHLYTERESPLSVSYSMGNNINYQSLLAQSMLLGDPKSSKVRFTNSVFVPASRQVVHSSAPSVPLDLSLSFISDDDEEEKSSKSPSLCREREELSSSIEPELFSSLPSAPQRP
jgi:hypothetical protein